MSIRYTADQLQRKFAGPAGSPGWSRVADTLRGEGRVDEAIGMCQEGLRLRPSLSGYLVLGKALMDAGRMEDAREQFEAALRLDPRCLSAMHFLARIMNKLQWAEAAAGYYRSILEVEPWDAEIRALLGEAAPGSGYAPAQQAADAAATGSLPLPAALPAEETFVKPDGLQGDVMEVNLNDMAEDFLPGGAAPEESLEDALASTAIPAAALAPELDAPATHAFASDAPAEAQDASDAPPISGQDVEDRLDSLFGAEDQPAPGSATATWTAAPALPETLSPEASATATGEMRASETGEMPIQSEPSAADDIRPFDLDAIPGIPGAPALPVPPDYSAVDIVTPAEETAPAYAAGAPAGDAAETPEASGEDSGRVQGEDIERRLDELFNLNEEDDRAPAIQAASLPVAPGPKVGEAVSMGESVAFGGGKLFGDALAADTGTAEARASQFVSAPEITMPSEPDAPVENPDIEEVSLAGEAPPAAEEEIITGQDVADKLDNLFGIETSEVPVTPAAFSTPAAKVPAPQAETPVFSEPKPWAKDDETPPPPPAGELMSTESMLPPGWFGDAGDGPRVTGADVEAQLDKLFNLEGDGEALEAPAATGIPEATVAPMSPTTPKAPAYEGPGAGAVDDQDQTLVMPAMKDPYAPTKNPFSKVPAAPEAEAPQPPQATNIPGDTARLKESVADWLSRQDDDARDEIAAPMPDAGETLILPSADETLRDFDATLELPSVGKAVGDEMETFGTLAPEDLAPLSETTSFEMVDGGDVAERLDELFADGGAAKTANAPEMSLFSPEDNAPGAPVGFGGSATLEVPVFGEDVSSRLNELFDAAPPAASAAATQSAEAGLTPGSDTDEELPPAPTGAVFNQPAPRGTVDLAPMTDEEEGYPEEEDMPAQGAAGSNVATVTLAEIYFQQGLREQALQIYRQLLEREPENDTVRKRIGEIEAAKPEGDDRDPGTDPRRPRPGLKVPKRKK